MQRLVALLHSSVKGQHPFARRLHSPFGGKQGGSQDIGCSPFSLNWKMGPRSSIEPSRQGDS